jgi:hypothetical protein
MPDLSGYIVSTQWHCPMAAQNSPPTPSLIRSGAQNASPYKSQGPAPAGPFSFWKNIFFKILVLVAVAMLWSITINIIGL